MKSQNFIRVALLVATTIASANLSFAQSWNVTGNTATDPATNFIGTTDNKALKIRTNNAVRVTVTGAGKVGIGNTSPDFKLDVKGVINTDSLYRLGGMQAISGDAVADRLQVGDVNTKIGIGTTAPNASLHVLSDNNLRALGVTNNKDTSTSTYGIYVGTDNDGNGNEYAGTFYALGTGTGGNYGIYSYAQNGSTNVGIVSGALTTVGQTGYGVMASSVGSGTNWGGYFSGQGYFSEKVGIGNNNPNHMLDVSNPSSATSSAIYAKVNYTGTVDVKAIEANSSPADGYGYGLYATGGYMGVRGAASSGTYSGTGYGVYGSASGSAGTRIGVYGTATGGTTNWSGYFTGNTYAGNLCVGTTTPATGYAMSVNGKVICEELKVELHANWPDYVFEKNHQLMPLDELEQQIAKDKHLPGIPSACEIEDNGGLHVGEMQSKMMEKIEELTLYVIQLKKDNDALQSKVNSITQK